MADYLLDTNVILRLHDGASPDQPVAQQAILKLRLRGHRVCLTAQNLVEFWAVVTRPITANGFGWDTAKAKLEVEQMIRRFPLLEESPAILSTWLTLVSARQVKGKRTHDIRLLAVMQSHQVTHLLTFNVADFSGFPNFTILHPGSIS
jgi:predicted nucleic acid-binding protein